MAKLRDFKRDWRILIITLSVSAVLAYTYFLNIENPNEEARLELHEQILAKTADSPYRYRVLVPFLTEGLSRVFNVLLPHAQALKLAYLTYDFLAILMFLLIFAVD